jgi:putative nucleotide binding protein
MTDAESDDREGPGTDAEATDATPHAVVLDSLPHGRPGDDRPQYEKAPIAYALGERDFRLVEVEMVDDADVSIGDRVAIDPDESDRIRSVRTVEYDDLSNSARSELDYAVEEIVEREADRFVDFFNDAQPITLRLHQLNLLPGIGKKLRNNVLDERKREPFADFADLTDRVSGLHDPKGVLVDRILEELREEDLKYRLFVRPDEEG